MAKVFVVKTGRYIVFMVAFLAFMSLFYLSSWIGEYQNRYLECDPNEILPIVERVFCIDFPEDIEQVKAAKPQIKRMPISFIIKFAADPNTVERFLESFPEDVKLEPYSVRLEHKDSRVGWFVPQWFKEPIKVGKRKVNIIAGPQKNLQELYIDTEDLKYYIIYIRGLYDTELLKTR